MWAHAKIYSISSFIIQMWCWQAAYSCPILLEDLQLISANLAVEHRKTSRHFFFQNTDIVSSGTRFITTGVIYRWFLPHYPKWLELSLIIYFGIYVVFFLVAYCHILRISYSQYFVRYVTKHASDDENTISIHSKIIWFRLSIERRLHF